MAAAPFFPFSGGAVHRPLWQAAVMALPALLLTTLAAIPAPPVFGIAPAFEVAHPAQLRPLADTSSGTPKTLLADAQAPTSNVPHIVPALPVRINADTSSGVPKALYADAQLPTSSWLLSAPPAPPIQGASWQGQPLTLREVTPAPIVNVSTAWPLALPWQVADSSRSTPVELFPVAAALPPGQALAFSPPSFLWLPGDTSHGLPKALLTEPVVACTDPYWSNVILYLPMDGAEGGSEFPDYSPLNRADTPVNSPTTTGAVTLMDDSVGKFVAASSQYITYPEDSSTILDGEFTIEVWCRLNRSSEDEALVVVGAYDAQGATPNTLQLYRYWFDNTFSIILGNSGSSWVRGTIVPAVDTPFHVAVTRDGSDDIKLWVDGVLDGTINRSLAFGDKTIHPGPVRTLIGAKAQWTPTEVVSSYLDGYLDGVRITKGVARYTSNFTPPSYYCLENRPFVTPQLFAPQALPWSLLDTSLSSPAILEALEEIAASRGLPWPFPKKGQHKKYHETDPREVRRELEALLETAQERLEDKPPPAIVQVAADYTALAETLAAARDADIPGMLAALERANLLLTAVERERVQLALDARRAHRMRRNRQLARILALLR